MAHNAPSGPLRFRHSVSPTPVSLRHRLRAIQVYTGRHYDLEAAFEAFENEFSIDIEFLQGSDAELRERLQAEGDDSSADIYMTVDAGNLATAAERSLPSSTRRCWRGDPAKLPTTALGTPSAPSADDVTRRAARSDDIPTTYEGSLKF